LDYLSFLTGGKMVVPFELFLVFSTNLNPAALGDEAFLRRIQYKMFLCSPSEKEFVRIFQEFCASRQLPLPAGMLERYLDKHYRAAGKAFRRCQPRDVLSHALNLIHFEKLPFALTDEILDRAFHSCFLEENADERAGDSPILSSHSPVPIPISTPISTPIRPAPPGDCREYWTARLLASDSSFRVLALLGAARASANGRYRDEESGRRFGADETARVMDEIHRQRFVQWRRSGPDRQARDLRKYLDTSAESLEALTGRLDEWVDRLLPSGSGEAARCLLAHDLAMLAAKLAPAPAGRNGPTEGLAMAAGHSWPQSERRHSA
jgi:hypothetical protein